MSKFHYNIIQFVVCSIGGGGSGELEVRTGRPTMQYAELEKNKHRKKLQFKQSAGTYSFGKPWKTEV